MFRELWNMIPVQLKLLYGFLIVAAVAFWGAVGYVAFHFISKVW